MWKLKVLIQYVLSKLPKGEELNYLLQRLGKSHNKNTKKKIIDLLNSLRKINKHVPLENATVVEIGTGWEPIPTILLYLMGVKRCYTYDHIPHARYNLAMQVVRIIDNNLDEISKIISISLSTLEKRIAKLLESKELDDFFRRGNIFYYAPGDAAMTNLEDSSVDLVYSHAVLEHVPVRTVFDLTLESKRILKNTGIAYHEIGEGDHYRDFDKNISKVNFLKYSEFWWSFFNHNNISYHNRLREKQFIDIFKKCGAKIIWKENKTDLNDVRILRDMKINEAFHGMSNEELAVWNTQLILIFEA